MKYCIRFKHKPTNKWYLLANGCTLQPHKTQDTLLLANHKLAMQIVTSCQNHPNFSDYEVVLGNAE